jgi:hypothetical protein
MEDNPEEKQPHSHVVWKYILILKHTRDSEQSEGALTREETRKEIKRYGLHTFSIFFLDKCRKTGIINVTGKIDKVCQ